MVRAIALLLLLGCAATKAPVPRSPESPPGDAPGATCGLSPDDWCPSPSGDACGRHADEAACRADPACVGMPYRGESFVACQPDGAGFWSNCPAVGCVTRPPATKDPPAKAL